MPFEIPVSHQTKIRLSPKLPGILKKEAKFGTVKKKKFECTKIEQYFFQGCMPVHKRKLQKSSEVSEFSHLAFNYGFTS